MKIITIEVLPPHDNDQSTSSSSKSSSSSSSSFRLAIFDGMDSSELLRTLAIKTGIDMNDNNDTRTVYFTTTGRRQRENDDEEANEGDEDDDDDDDGDVVALTSALPNGTKLYLHQRKKQQHQSTTTSSSTTSKKRKKSGGIGGKKKRKDPSTAAQQTQSVVTDLVEESVLAAQRGDGGGNYGDISDDDDDDDDDDVDDNVPIAYNASIATARRCRPFQQQQQQHRKQPPPSSKKKKKKTITMATQATQTCPSWEMMFYQLVLYKLSHNGSCLVDLDNNNNDDDEERNKYSHLSTWVEEQRELYGSGSIEKDHIIALTSLEFVWEIMQKRKYLSCNIAWEEKFQQLKDYLKTHNGDHPHHSSSLGSWTNSQRLSHNAYHKTLQQYREKYPNQPIIRPEELMIPRKNAAAVDDENETVKLGLLPRLGQGLITQERIDKLNSIGLQWRLVPERTSFEDRLHELRIYRDLHGNCCVPQHYSENKQLGKWVTKQRYQYNLKQQGKKNQMTDDRIKQLANVGFEFTSRVHKKQRTTKVSAAIETTTPEPDNNVLPYEDIAEI